MRIALLIAGLLGGGCSSESQESIPFADDGGNAADASPVDGGGNPAADAGAISDAAWRVETKLASAGTAAGSFGWSLALSADGSTLAIGETRQVLGATSASRGWVHVFVKSGGQWVLQATITPAGGDDRDGFGASVALSADGNTLAAGAPYEDSAATGVGGDAADNTKNAAGAAYVFTRTGQTWSERAYLKASNTESDEVFGMAIALSGDGRTVAVGAHHEGSKGVGVNGDPSTDPRRTGAVYVFASTGGAWSQQAFIKAPALVTPSPLFGLAVSLSSDGDTLAVGAPWENSAATGIGGDPANTNAYTSGAAYVYTRASSTWALQAYLKSSNSEGGVYFPGGGACPPACNSPGDQFGWSVALSGDGQTLAVGANHEDSAATGAGGDQTSNAAVSSGAVYVFKRSGPTWVQEQYLKASTPGAGDWFGQGVSLSSNGDTLAVAAGNEDSKASGVDGDQADNSLQDSGAVYLFDRGQGGWAQRAYLKAAMPQSGSSLGASFVYGFIQVGNALSLSGDGNTVAAGAFRETAAKAESGAAHVFTRAP
jgi:hypothetical protein